MNCWKNGLDEEIPRQDVMAIPRSRGREEIKKGRDGEEKGTEEGLDEEKTEGDYRSGSYDD